MRKKLLIVDDNPVDRQVICSIVEKLGFEAFPASSGEEAVFYIEKDKANSIALVILDLYMPGLDGFETLNKIKSLKPKMQVCILTGSTQLKDAILVMNMGAADYIRKPAEEERLFISIQNALKISELDNEVNLLRKKRDGRLLFSDMVGYNKGLQAATKLGESVASSNNPILLSGETGTGKKLFAKAIHGESNRSGNPFIAVNCANISDNLAESILFGHEKTAFNGIISSAAGKLREARGGTIFFDKIEGLPLQFQKKLIRAIKSNEIIPVGGKKPVSIDIRIIASTNRNLANLVSEGLFDEELHHFINNHQIEIPPLRKRTEDIADLADYFCYKYSTIENKPIMEISISVYNKLNMYKWPGNVRELEKSISRAVLISNGTSINDSAIDLGNNDISQEQYSNISLYHENGKVKKMKEIEGEVIELYLKRFRNRPQAAANALGIGLATIYRKKKQLAG
ncbi:MAG: hypothetical protein COV36_04180 [Alphaproteobacteria bacterium CG11_big_fil_rev_8_21_14_0_20_44_7]|nr:MAG: hypothetical protein COV36_04180 [Alphaproteobacteria bacterium CG11_big_fil_rev_8_21_14_0_20_44_7]